MVDRYFSSSPRKITVYNAKLWSFLVLLHNMPNEFVTKLNIMRHHHLYNCSRSSSMSIPPEHGEHRCNEDGKCTIRETTNPTLNGSTDDENFSCHRGSAHSLYTDLIPVHKAIFTMKGDLQASPWTNHLFWGKRLSRQVDSGPIPTSSVSLEVLDLCFKQNKQSPLKIITQMKLTRMDGIRYPGKNGHCCRWHVTASLTWTIWNKMHLAKMTFFCRIIRK